MNTHKTCVHGEVRKSINTFGLKKKNMLSRAVYNDKKTNLPNPPENF